MIRKIEDFEAEWKKESALTIKIFSAISNDKLHQKPNDNIRSLGKLAWHITQTLTEMPFKAELIDEDNLESKEVPATIAEIVETYTEYSDMILNKVKENWTDENLLDKLEIYGQEWRKTILLSVLINHQIHHRAQMTVIMRLLNITVPGIYGPAKEEWANFGMPAQD